MLEKKTLEVEKTVIVGIINAQQDEEKSKEYLDELAFLALTAGGKVIRRFTQKINLPNPKTFIRKREVRRGASLCGSSRSGNGGFRR